MAVRWGVLVSFAWVPAGVREWGLRACIHTRNIFGGVRCENAGWRREACASNHKLDAVPASIHLDEDVLWIGGFGGERRFVACLRLTSSAR